MSFGESSTLAMRRSKKHLLQDIDVCEMQNSYSKRLHYQQLKGMYFSNKYRNIGFVNESRDNIYSTDLNKSNNFKDAELRKYMTTDNKSNMENEGENISYSSLCNSVSPSVFDVPFEIDEGRKTNISTHKSWPGIDTSIDTTFTDGNSFASFKDNSSVQVTSDRYIPARKGSAWQKRFSMLSDEKITCSKTRRCKNSCIIHESIGDSHPAYSSLLKNELLDSNIKSVKSHCEQKGLSLKSETVNLFHYSSHREPATNIESVAPYSLSPVSPNSQKLLRSPRKATRKISGIPFKVLDAPELQDDFYLNLVDWSSQNVLTVGLGSSVYLWSACTSQVTRLCDLSADSNSVTSVSWNERGNLVAVGTHHGYVQVWDVAANKQISKLLGHSARVGALAWCGDVLSSGSRDRLILQRDIRSSSNSERRLVGHRQEVCGLKWSTDTQHLASGGNDNRLLVWNMHSLTPLQIYTEHVAAVKAIAWSPHHHGLLASGGGTADRCIRFWNTLTGQPMQCVDTGSQVCNLAWSKHSSELVSTHGYSQNQILVWKYPAMTQVAKLTGHSYRVLYLAMSPDGESIVTGAGDETLRFWNVFSKVRSQKDNKSVLNLYGRIR